MSTHAAKPSPHRKPETPTRRCRCCLNLIAAKRSRCHCYPYMCGACGRCDLHCTCDK